MTASSPPLRVRKPWKATAETRVKRSGLANTATGAGGWLSFGLDVLETLSTLSRLPPGADVPCSRWRCPSCRAPTGLSWRPATELELGLHYVGAASKTAACGGSGATALDIKLFFRMLAAAQGQPPLAEAAAEQERPAACSRVALPAVLVDAVVGFRLRGLLEPERGWRLRWWLAVAAALACCLAMLCVLGELTRATNRASCLFVLGRRERWCYEELTPFAMPLWFEVAGLLLASQLAHSLWLVTPFRVLLYFDRCVLPAVGLWAGVSLLFALLVLAMRLVFEAGAAFTT